MNEKTAPLEEQSIRAGKKSIMFAAESRRVLPGKIRPRKAKGKRAAENSAKKIGLPKKEYGRLISKDANCIMPAIRQGKRMMFRKRMNAPRLIEDAEKIKKAAGEKKTRP